MCNTDNNLELDLDKQFNEYIIEQFNKLINIVIEYDKLDSRGKLHYLIDLGYHDNDSGAEDEHNSGDNNNGVTHIDSPDLNHHDTDPYHN